MLGVYNRLAVEDVRLIAVSDHVHDWLYPKKAKSDPKKAATRHRYPATTSRPPLRSRLNNCPLLGEGFEIGRIHSILGTAIFSLGDIVAAKPPGTYPCQHLVRAYAQETGYFWHGQGLAWLLLRPREQLPRKTQCIVAAM